MLRGSLKKSLDSKHRLARILNSNGLRWFSAFCYNFAARKVIQLGDGSKATFWTRNSYVTGNLVYGLSDIDFTLYLRDLDFPCDEGPYLKRYENLKRFFPFLGEINIYKQSQEELIAKLINPLELERDPTLAQREILRIDPTYKTDVDRFTYLFRMFLSDKENILLTPGARIAKWKRHFKAIDIDVSKLSSDNLYSSIIEALINLSHESFRQTLEDFMSLPNSINNRLLISNLITFAPQLWHFSFRGVSEVQAVVYQISESSFRDQNYFFSQLKWELFGLITQLPMIEDKFFQYHYHLPYLIKLLENMSCSYTHEDIRINLIDGFTEVLRLLKVDFRSFSCPDAFVPIEFSAIEL